MVSIIIASLAKNSNGVGEVFNDTIFVGRDLPTAVENLTFKGDSDNANLRISWSKPSTGVNGGLVLAGETKYNVYSYNHTNSELTPVASNVEGESYLVDVNNLDAQKLYYYAVSAVNSEGEGKAIASSIVLGKRMNSRLLSRLPIHPSPLKCGR